MEYGFSDLLTDYVKRTDRYPFHMPGHKRHSFEDVTKQLMASGKISESCLLPKPPEWIGKLYSLDVTEVPDLDDCNHPEGVLLDLTKALAAEYGADRSFLLMNGSTGGILAAIEAVTNFGDEILIARNCHASVYREIVHRGLKPYYIYPDFVTDFSVSGSIQAQQVEEMLAKHVKIKAVVIVSPTYEGIVSDIRAIAEVVHAHHAVLIVDEAHGAHFHFVKDGWSALDCGADLVIQSLHKTLPAPTQTAVLHRKGEGVNEKRLEDAIAYVHSTSPSYLLVAGADACLRYLFAVGRILMEQFYDRLEVFYQRVTKLKEVAILKSGNRDLSKIVIKARHEQMNGVEIADWLRKYAGIEIEMCTPEYALLMTTAFDTEEAIFSLEEHLKILDNELIIRENKKICKAEKGQSKRRMVSYPQRILTPYEALCLEPEGRIADEVEPALSEGMISRSTVYIYPPGSPMLVAGERVDRAVLEQLLEVQAHGFLVRGLTKEGKLPVWR